MVMDQMAEDKTCLTIAQRISTIKESDRIILLSKGTVLEEGTYEELIEAKGHFYEFERGLLEQ